MRWEENPRLRRHWLLTIIVMLACATAVFLWFDSLGSHPMRAPSTAAAGTTVQHDPSR